MITILHELFFLSKADRYSLKRRLIIEHGLTSDDLKLMCDADLIELIRSKKTR